MLKMNESSVSSVSPLPGATRTKKEVSVGMFPRVLDSCLNQVTDNFIKYIIVLSGIA